MEIRKRDNQPLTEKDFKSRFEEQFKDPWFAPHRAAIKELSDIAWKTQSEGRKSPITQKAGDEFSDPNYDLSVDWYRTRQKIREAQRQHEDPTSPSQILIIAGSDRNDYTCPGEISKTWRLTQLAEKVFNQQSHVKTDILDLSLISSEYGRHIHPCKGCVSTAMPLCHWPCSCYPNYALGQVNDWMNEIYPKWVAAHGVMIITPTYWYQAPSTLKLMIDRLVCADGGNPDPTRTHGKDPKKAKELELQGWSYPRHLEGRFFSVICHGDAEGPDNLRNNLTNWLKDMKLQPAGLQSDVARYVGYYEPYATSHSALDDDIAFQREVQNAALSLALTVKAARRGKLDELKPPIEDVRPK